MFSLRFAALALLLLLFSSVALAGPPVSSPTHPDPEKWYKGNSPIFEIGESGGYSYKLDLFPDTIPQEDIISNNSTVSYSNRTDGVQYFHVRVKSGGVWSDTTHFKIQIDRTKPLQPQKPTAKVLEDGSIELSWEPAIDIHSGVAWYKIYRSFIRDFDIQFDFYEIISEETEGTTFIDTDIEAGRTHHYRLQAIDNVGNVGGLTGSFVARAPPKCDFELEIETSFEDEILSIRIDSSPHIMYFAKLILIPSDGEEITLFTSISNEDLFLETVDLSELDDQEILIDFDVKDRNNDICDVEQTFFLDRQKPDGEWVFPQENDVIKETVVLKVKAFDTGLNPSGVSAVEFFYDDGNLQKIGDAQKGENDEYFLEWDSLGAPNGRFKFIAKIFDDAGSVEEKEIMVQIKNTAIISAEAMQAIEQAEEKKQSTQELEEQIKLLGIEAPKFFELMESADSNLLRAKELFDGGVNFERAKADAQTALDTFEQATAFVSIERTDSLQRVFKAGELEASFQKVGLALHLILQAKESLELYAPVRRLDFFKVVDGNETFYKMLFVITIAGSDYNNDNIQIIEVIPKEVAPNTNGFSTSLASFQILNHDPVINFYVDLNETRKISYSVGKRLSKSEVNKLIKENPLKSFESLPIVLSADTKVDSSTVVKPFDLFEAIEPIVGEYDAFTLFLFGAGAFAILFVVLGIISFFIVLIAVLKSR